MRILDANANRACEALRVAEDYARFALDWAALTVELKGLRHEVRGAFAELSKVAARAERGNGPPYFMPHLRARNAEEDVGSPSVVRGDDAWRCAKGLRGTSEDSHAVVATRNLRRVQESLRSLEEAAKVIDARIARRFAAARFVGYSLEQKLCLAALPRPLRRAEGVYVLISEDIARRPGMEVLRNVLAAGVRWVQLREKHMPKRQFLRYARAAREATRRYGARLVVNDHVDVALLARADGVHLGEKDITVRDARRLAGDRLIIGATSHSMAEALSAAGEGADYVSIGPVFASKIKPGLAPRGLEFVKEAVRRLRLPFVAIGGIAPENVGRVMRAGARWVAVSSAIIAASNVKTAAELIVSKASYKR